MDDNNYDGYVWLWTLALLMGLMILLIIISSWGCATLGQVGELKQSLADVQAEVSGLRVGDVSLHGDSVTQWILAGGAALVYPLIWRPVRRWRQNGRKAQ